MLYKYASYNKYSIDNIKKSTLWMNTSIGFNDPFDTFASFKLNDNDRKEYIDWCKKENQYKANDEKSKIADSFNKDEILAIKYLTIRGKKFNSKYGITCFSKSDSNILMWSHYADSHKGICLGYDLNEHGDLNETFFDKDKNKEDYKYKLFSIDYTDKRPQIRASIKQFSDIETKMGLKTKFNLWKYEKEVRLLIRAQENQLFPSVMHYKKQCLKEIIFGAVMTWGDIVDFYRDLKKNIDYKNINLYGMQLDLDEYKLNKIPITKDKLNCLINNYEYIISSKGKMFNYFAKKYEYIGSVRKKKYKSWRNNLRDIPLTIIFSQLQFLLERDIQNYSICAFQSELPFLIFLIKE